jgi:subfamily B ATP-binding cassette protein MsbA
VTTWRRLLGYLGPYRSRLALALAAMAILAATTGLYPIALDLLTTLLVEGTSSAGRVLEPAIAKLSSWTGRFGVPIDASSAAAFAREHFIALFAAIVALKAVSQAVRFYQMGMIAQWVVRDLRRDLFGAIVRQSAGFFGEQATGYLVSRVVNDVSQVERAATYAVPVLVGDVLKVLVLAAVCLSAYPELSLVAVVVTPVAIIPIVRFGKMLKRYAKQGQEELGALTNRVTETVGGIRVVQAYAGEAREAERFGEAAEAYVRAMKKSVVVRAVQTPAMELIGVAALLLTLGYATTRLEANAIRPGEVVGFVLALVLLYEPLKAIGRLSTFVLPGLASAERIFEVVDRPSDLVDRPGAGVCPAEPQLLRFEDVSFRYRSEGANVLESVSLELPRGKVVALAGPSGGGKSTIAGLLPRFFDPTSGRITIDGVELRDVSLASLRSRIALVAQETYLFNDTVRANIAYGRPGATDAEIEAAARRAHAHEFIAALPKGYDTTTGERGVQLSGGQRQRIAIARAFLKDAPILLLDEATSALDVESEREVQLALDALLANRTALVIAHRLSTIRRADEIVVLDRGRIVERGRHEALVANGGTYARLVAVSEGSACT